METVGLIISLTALGISLTAFTLILKHKKLELSE
ncbi:hypothetical protein ABID56_002611 [Alkalibacillus flavidus]|uniref:Holin-like toxin n=1 Tax=Alkalibacillus flavidus TaxID=546021 RepID=A0ABV2KYI5_9BACI